MNDLLHLPFNDRRPYFEQAAALSGFPPAIIEKDFWVCWGLAELFGMPDWGEHLLFKGGTSLSKCYGLIKRFSEDIDIVINREKLGFPGDHSLSNNQLKKLRKACQNAVGIEIRGSLQAAIDSSPCRQFLQVYLDGSDPDESTLLISYVSHFPDTHSYINPSVRIEMGARSDTWPSGNRLIYTMVSEALPEVVEKMGVNVGTLSPKRTFWEKAMLLHEENYRPEEKKRKARMARHYYDLWCLIHAGVAHEAAVDMKLFESVIDHRQVFFRHKWVDYGTLKKGSLQILPVPKHEPGWKEDYEAMNSFFFPDEQPPTWDEIIQVIGDFEKTFNTFG